jgi:hypothetical protein
VPRIAELTAVKTLYLGGDQFLGEADVDPLALQARVKHSGNKWTLKLDKWK